MTGKKSSSKAIIIVITIVFIALLAGLFITQPPVPQTTQESAVEAVVQQPEATMPVPEQPALAADTAFFDVNAALGDRILGDTNAPLKISEHSSLTCSHCGQFHRETFEQVKTNYIDTGKAYLIFSDFPLNAPALKAGMVARCLPQEKYFEFINMLFMRQDEWAYDPQYIDWLRARAAENGMSPAAFNTCINNVELEEGLKARMKAVTDQWHIASTPSFVLNNKTVISGAYPYDAFSKALESELTGVPVEGAAVPADAHIPPHPPAAPPATAPQE